MNEPLRQGQEPARLPDVGDVIAGKYRLIGVLGRGGMGVVFDGHHSILNRGVAIKVLAPEIIGNVQAVTRFMNEARAVARLNSEHVVSVLDAGTLPGGLPFMVMERLDGTDLGRLLEEGKIQKVEDAIDFVAEGIEGVAHAHLEGIIHRDLKPANLFLARKPDGTAVVKVLDFGVSKFADGNVGVTTTAATIGTPAYMSPEQLRNSKAIDRRADVWSLGVITYELLTNTLPFDADSAVGLFAAIFESSPKPPSQLRPDIRAELEAAVLRALRPDREARYGSVFSFVRALAPFGTLRAAAVVARLESLLSSKGLDFVSVEAMPLPSTTLAEDVTAVLPGTVTDSFESESKVTRREAVVAAVPPPRIPSEEGSVYAAPKERRASRDAERSDGGLRQAAFFFVIAAVAATVGVLLVRANSRHESASESAPAVTATREAAPLSSASAPPRAPTVAPIEAVVADEAPPPRSAPSSVPTAQPPGPPPAKHPAPAAPPKSATRPIGKPPSNPNPLTMQPF